MGPRHSQSLLVDGLTTREVAARLYLAPKTILNRVSAIIAKLGVSSRAEAIALGSAAGLGHRPGGGSASNQARDVEAST